MTLVLSREEVASALDMPTAIDAVEAALIQASLGQTVQPVRFGLSIPDYRTVMYSMSAHLRATDALGMKIVTVAPANVNRGLPTVMGVVALCDPQTGQFLALMDGTYLTAMRTGAASAVATRHLAMPEASILGILGAGVQARTQLRAIMTVRPIKRVKVHDAVTERAVQFSREMEDRLGLPVEIHESPETVVRGSDIVVTVTTSKTPVLRGSWLKEGAHVNAVGAHNPHDRELDSEAVARAKVVTDSLEALFAESGDVLIPISEGRIPREHIYGEIGEIAAGQRQGRVSPQEITLFKSLGVAAEDVATAKLVYERATEMGLGIRVRLGD